RAALAMIHDLDPEAWGAAWMAVGDRHAGRAQALEASDIAGAAQAYLAHGRLVTPAIEPVSIPFEGRDIKLWLQKPAGAARPPVTINIGGSDLWKDSVAIQARGF